MELAADTLSAIGLTHGVVHLKLFYAQVLTPPCCFHPEAFAASERNGNNSHRFKGFRLFLLLLPAPAALWAGVH